MFKIRRAMVVLGGSVQLGADSNIYRSGENAIKTDDGFIVGGTPFAVPYSTSSPTVNTSGQIAVYHKSHVPYLALYSGGTAHVARLPTTTHGTITWTVGSVP